MLFVWLRVRLGGVLGGAAPPAKDWMCGVQRGRSYYRVLTHICHLFYRQKDKKKTFKACGWPYHIGGRRPRCAEKKKKGGGGLYTPRTGGSGLPPTKKPPALVPTHTTSHTHKYLLGVPLSGDALVAVWLHGSAAGEFSIPPLNDVVINSPL
jgi:hypothetical protein